MNSSSLTAVLSVLLLAVLAGGCASQSAEQRLGRLDQTHAEVSKAIKVAAENDLITDVPTLKRLRAGLIEAERLRKAAHAAFAPGGQRDPAAIGDAESALSRLNRQRQEAAKEPLSWTPSPLLQWPPRPSKPVLALSDWSRTLRPAAS